MNTDIAKVESTLAQFDAVELGLADLRAKYVGVVYPVQTTKGLEDAKAARMAIREPRYAVEKARKDAKAPLLALGKTLDARAAKITAEIETIEAPVHDQIVAEEARKEAQRQERERIERERIDGIRDRIANFGQIVLDCTDSSPAEVFTAITAVTAIAIDLETFAEFTGVAAQAKDEALQKLAELHAKAEAREAEAARLKAEKEQLVRDQAEQRERERTAKADQDRLNAELRQQQEALAKQQREAEANIRKAKEEQEAEARRLTREREEFERKQALAAKPRVRVPVGAPVVIDRRIPDRPSDDEILTVLARHYGVPEARVVGWLKAMDFEDQELRLAAA